MIFFHSKEAGKSISADNLKKIQNIHDTASSLGAGCGMGSVGGMYESARMTEAALPMNTSHDALRGHLRDSLMQAHKVTSTYDSNGPYVTDVFPQHVVYSHKGETYKRPYSVEQGAAGSDPKVTLGDAKKVHVAYVDSKDQDKESMRILTDYPADWEEAREVYISQAERDKMPKTDFAGKGTSFPIRNEKDVEDALHDIGRAGADNLDHATIKKNILAIAKRKGLGVPHHEDTTSEGVMITLPDGSELVRESVIFCDPIKPVKEAKGSGGKTVIPICIIKPGWGSCAYYSKEMIQKTGPQAFTKGTQMFINHATESEEMLRPEGDYNALAAVLNKNAYWDENGPKGPALYSEALLFSDHADKILEKGPHTGVSINAAIRGKEGTAEGKTGKLAEAFVKAFSVDFVTKAGAGGAPIVPVTESARVAPAEETSMSLTAEQEQALRTENETLKAKVRTLESQQNKIVAMATVSGLVRESGGSVKQSLLELVCDNPKLTESGKIDPEWAKRVAEDVSTIGVSESARVTGVGDTTHRTEKGEKEVVEGYKANLKELGIPEAGLAYAMEGFGR